MNQIFARIIKVDARTRTVTGRAAQEVVDRSGEIFDYKSSVPHFKRWSAEVHADTNGKSYGNVRSMHGNVAAGKLTDIEFNDVEKAIDVTAKIIDEQEWEKVCEGVHTGFSIGGSYANKQPEVVDGKMITRYTAIPSEISLVDRPCIPTAKFDFTKRDGSTVRRRFAKSSGSNLAAAMNTFQTALEKNGMSKKNDIAAIRKIHAQGASPFAYDLLHKYATEAGAASDRTVAAIRKAHGTPRGLNPYGNRTVDVAALAKMIRRGSKMRKSVALPRESSNISDADGLANTGASNDWRDQIAPTTKPTRIGGQVIGAPTQSDMDAVLAAIKQDLARGAKRSG